MQVSLKKIENSKMKKFKMYYLKDKISGKNRQEKKSTLALAT